MIHYHGTPITPRATLLSELVGRCFCVRFSDNPDEMRDLEVCHEIGQSVMLDNGAYPAWTRGRAVDWDGYYEWVAPWLDYRTTWAVIPDVIDGTEAENNTLLGQWPFGDRGAPVWHLHEPIVRLEALCSCWPRVCLGSSGAFREIGSAGWHARMSEAMTAICGDGPPPCWIHMLRGLSLAGSRYPFTSADSTSIAQNHAGNQTRATPRKSMRRMADELDGRQCAARWRVPEPQLDLLHTPGTDAAGDPAINERIV